MTNPQKTREMIREKVKLLKTPEDKIKLTEVYPSIIEEALGEFEECPEINGWQCDYWAKIGRYAIFGTMYYGTAEIRLREDW